MSNKTPSPGSPVVFISYAHESDHLRQEVKALADWLGAHRCRVLTDHAFADRPPALGWQGWMMNSIQEADTVLVVCTPKLRERYDGTAPPGAGRGATFEGVIVTQHIYDEMMHNTKFYPVLPDGGDDADIPTTLRPWSNGHRFPSVRAGILALVLASPTAETSATEGTSDGSTPPFGITSKHQEFVFDLLAGVEARPFLAALLAELGSDSVSATSALDVVRHFASDQSPAAAREAALNRFDYVRRALRPSTVCDSARRAAAALYCLAACSLVNREVAEGQAQASGSRFVLHVPSAHDLVLAVTATALFGGRLELQDDANSHGLRGRHVHRVSLPLSGDWVEHDLERVMLATLSANDENLPELTQGTGPLTDAQRATLRAKLRGVRRTHRHAFALVLPGMTDPAMVRTVAERYEAPILISTSIASELFGLDADDFHAEVDDFLREYRTPPQEPSSRTQSSQKDGTTQDASPPSAVSLHVAGQNVVVSMGKGSIAQAGTVLRAKHVSGSSLADLLPLLEGLVAAVRSVPSAKTRESLESEVDTVRAEVAKGADADPGVVKGAIEKVKSVGDAIEGGEKIVELCDKLLRAAGLLAGLGSLL